MRKRLSIILFVLLSVVSVFSLASCKTKCPSCGSKNTAKEKLFGETLHVCKDCGEVW